MIGGAAPHTFADPTAPARAFAGVLLRGSAELRRAAAGDLADLAAGAAGRLEGLPSRLALIAGSVLPEWIEPCAAADLGAAASLRAADACHILSRQPAADLATAEVRNKAAIFALVLAAGPLIGTPAEPFPPRLRLLVERAYALGDFPALWVVEGLGHDYTGSFWRHGIVPRGLLRVRRSPALPPESLLMLHAGLGLSLAENLLRQVPSGAPASEMRRAVARFVRLARSNSRPGYLGAALESLGLVSRLFFPPKVEAVGRALRCVAPEVEDFFWHGFGRALYFSPVNFLPFSLQQAFAMAARETPDPAARRNAVAGISWAFTLVNERQPRIMAELMLAPCGERLRRDPGFGSAFTNGVVSTILMRQSTTPGAAFNLAFPAYRPREARLRALWRRFVGAPAVRGLAVELPALERAGRLGELFRFRPQAFPAAEAA